MVQRQDNGAVEAYLGSLFAGVAAYHYMPCGKRRSSGGSESTSAEGGATGGGVHCPGCFDCGALNFGDCLPFCHGRLDHLALDFLI